MARTYPVGPRQGPGVSDTGADLQSRSGGALRTPSLPLLSPLCRARYPYPTLIIRLPSPWTQSSLGHQLVIDHHPGGGCGHCATWSAPIDTGRGNFGVRQQPRCLRATRSFSEAVLLLFLLEPSRPRRSDPVAANMCVLFVTRQRLGEWSPGALGAV